MSLISSKQDTQRREALAALTNTLLDRDQTADLPAATVTIVSKVRPCLIDASRSTREQSLKLLKALNPVDLAYHVSHILVYVHIGMVHLAADIRLSALDVLEWLTQISPDELVSCPGGWSKTLMILVTLLKWHSQVKDDSAGWSSAAQGVNHRVGSDGKLKARQITVLAHLLEAGLQSTVKGDSDIRLDAAHTFPLWHVRHHCQGRQPNPFAYLKLFGAVADDENAVYDDVVSRADFFVRELRNSVVAGMKEAVREGGDLGRAASALAKALKNLPSATATTEHDGG